MDEKILVITKKFHDTYERLSKDYNYETRKATKVFDITSNNGKLMYATVNEVVGPILNENQELKQKLESEYRDYSFLQEDNELLLSAIRELKDKQKEFIKYLEDEIKKEKEDLEQLCDLYKIPKENNSTYKFAYSYINKMKEISQKYKEIIGVSDENN